MRASLASALLPCRKLVSSNLFVQGSPPGNQLQDVLLRYRDTKSAALPVNADVFPPFFKACASLQSVKQGISAHSDVIKMGFVSFTSTCNTIMSFYAKCGMMDSAVTLFDGMVNKDSVSWNLMIHGFLAQGDPETGLGLFHQARCSAFKPNVATLVLVIQACWRVGAAAEGLNMHGIVIRHGFSSDASLQNSLVTMYAKSQDLLSARRLFDEMSERDVISWSALISGYAQSAEAAGALRLFREMSNEGTVNIDGLAAVSVLQACGGIGDINLGNAIHGHLIRRGFEAGMFVGNSLVDMYSKCRDVNSARKAFELMPQKNIVSWNSILTGLVHNEKYQEALALIESMKGLEFDEVTLVNVLQLCKKFGQAGWCRSVHSVIIRRHLMLNASLLNCLLDAYAKCYLMELAAELFEQMEKRNVISWSTMIAGFAHCGKPDEAVAFFKGMQLVGEKPNSVTILSLLEACSVSTEWKLSKCAHGVAVRNALADHSAVGTALLDMYAKCGDLDASRKVFRQMPERNILSWNAMIGALGMNGCAPEALAVLREMESEHVKPNGVTMLSVISACSHGGFVKEGLSCFQRMLQDPLLGPCSEHYSCVVDMLARSGDLDGALEVIKRMPQGLEAGPAAWGALLSACTSHGNYELGREAASHVLELEPLNSAGYLLASGMHAKDSSRADIARIRLLMKEKGVRVMSGYSLVHVNHKPHKFVAWDWSHPESKEIYSMVQLLHSLMKLTGQIDFHIT